MTIVVNVALVVLAVAFMVAVLRVAIGPSLADRAVAADVGLFSVVAGLALLSVRFESSAYVDSVLIATLLGFVATASLAWLIARMRR